MTRIGSKTEYTGPLYSAIERILAQRGEDNSSLAMQFLKGDGSTRRFVRVENSDGSKYIAVAPPESSGHKENREAVASWKIGAHLRQALVAVPEIYGFDREQHLLLYEDLGDTQLHGLVAALDFQDEKDQVTARQIYRKTISELQKMQLQGAQGFCKDWCWDTVQYDRQLMIERESKYFLKAFWQDLLQQDVPDGLIGEFEELAGKAAAIPGHYFLHRDFQSRNIMIKAGAVRIIDYQGGRLGPLGYDLASLLIDPYVKLPAWFQREMLDYYYEQLSRQVDIGEDEFRRQYLLLALQRNLQIVGAFAFLSNVRQKPFFKAYIKPAVYSLSELVDEYKTTSGTVDLTNFVEVLKRSADILKREEL